MTKKKKYRGMCGERERERDEEKNIFRQFRRRAVLEATRVSSFSQEFTLQLVVGVCWKRGGRMSLVCRMRSRHSSPESESELGGGGPWGVLGGV